MQFETDFVFRRHPEPMFLFDVASLRFLDVNEAACARYGWTREEFRGMTIADIRPREDVEKLRKSLARAQDGLSPPGIWRHRRRDGTVFPVEVVTYAMEHEGRRAKLVVARDISRLRKLEQERKRALSRERAARAETERLAQRFRALFESVPGNILVVAPEGFEIVAASDAYLRVTRRSRDDLIGRNIFDVFPDDPADPDADGTRMLRASFDRALASGRADLMAVQRYPIPRPPEEGGGFEERYWSPVNTPIHGANGEVAWIFHQVEDVTALVAHRQLAAGDVAPITPADPIHALLRQSQELKRANVRLEEEIAEMHLARRVLRLVTWHFDPDTGLVTMTPELRSFLGIGAATFDNALENFLTLVHPDDRDRVRDAFTSFEASSANVFRARHRVIRPRDGRLMHVVTAGERLRDAAGRVQMKGIIQDVSELAEAQEARDRALQLNRIAGRAAGLGGWHYDLATARLTWTDETFRIYGLPRTEPPSPEATIGFYLEEDRPRIREVFNACRTAGTPFDEVQQIDTADGRRIWVRVVGEPVQDAAGRITGVEGAFQDIDDLVRVRERAAELSGQLARTLERISDGFLTLDRDWNFRFVNVHAGRLLRRAPSELLGRNIWAEYPEMVGSRFQRYYETVARTGKTARFEEYFPPLDAWFQVNAHAAPDGLAVYFRDITDRKRAEDALRASEQRFRLIARASSEVFWDWDVESDSIWWSDGMTAVFGHPVDSEGARPGQPGAHIHPDDADAVMANLHAAVQGEAGEWSARYRFRRADGSWATVDDRAFIIRDATGRAVRVLGNMSDVTEKLQLEERLRQAQKLEAVGQLTGGVAHDFNNLLTVILGNAEQMAEELVHDRRLREMAEMTASAALRGAELTSRLLAFARRQALQPKVVRLNQLVAGMEGLVRRTLSEDIDIQFVQSAELWPAEVDPGQLEVALLNLVINARDAMPGGGRITIETANAHLDENHPATRYDIPPGQYVMVAVSDSGTGMPADVVDRAFDPFFTTKEVGKGSGLGLSMVYGFVRQSKGHVRIYSEPDEGTTVKLYFPRAAGAEAAQASTGDAAEAARGREHVLVVEDDELVRKHVVALLGSLGYRVSAAADGPAALDIIRARADIDLLFTDIVMPRGMSGRDLAEVAGQIRPGLRVLFTSGYTQNSVVHNGRLDPGVELMQKPYRRQELARRVRRVLDA